MNEKDEILVGNSAENTADNSLEKLEQKRADFQNKLVTHTPEARLQAARDLEDLKNEHKKDTTSKKKKEEKIVFGPDGRVLQRNEGTWDFKWSETQKTLVLDVAISKFIDTSLVAVDLHTTWIRITIKEKILQLVLDTEVVVSNVLCERSKASGNLLVTMLKSKFREQDIVKIRNDEWKQEEIKKKSVKNEEKPARNRRYERLFEPKEAVNIRNILEQVKLDEKPRAGENGIIDVKTSAHEWNIDDDFVDDPEVPPLC